MDVKDNHDAIIAKISKGMISNAAGGLLGRIEKNKVTDTTGTTVGYIKQTTITGADFRGVALFSNGELSTYSGAMMFSFKGNTILDYAETIVFRLSEDFAKFAEELIAFIIFFSSVWKDTSKIYTTPAY